MDRYRKLVSTVLIFATTQAIAADAKEPHLLQSTQEVSETSGIGQLKETQLPDTESEIRIWMGFGIVEPDHLLRLRTDSSGVVSGEVLVYLHSDLTRPQDAAQFRREIRNHCTNLRNGRKLAVCIGRFRRKPDWQALYRELIVLDVTTLPDESELPKPDLDVDDGQSIVVEVRQGSSYRAYEYSNPIFRIQPEAHAASEIMRIVGDVFRQLRAK